MLATLRRCPLWKQQHMTGPPIACLCCPMTSNALKGRTSLLTAAATQELLAQLPNGEVREEDLEGLVRWATC